MHNNIEGRDERALARTTASVQQAEATSTTPQLADVASQSDRIEIADRRGGVGNEGGRRMTAEREAQIRQRVQDGTYNSLSVVDEVARRLLRSADL